MLAAAPRPELAKIACVLPRGPSRCTEHAHDSILHWQYTWEASFNDLVKQQLLFPASQPCPRAVSPNSNNPVLVSRIDDHSPRRKKKLPVQSAVLLSSAPRRLTGQNVGGISLGYEGVHVYRGWGYHGAHAGLLRHSPQRAPSL